MLFQPFIAFVVLTINLSSINAMEKPNEQNQQHTVQKYAAMNYPQNNPHRPAYQSPQHGQFANHRPLQRMTPPLEDPNFTEAHCRLSHYNRDDIIYARKEGCQRMPFYHDNIVGRKAVAYIPANPRKYGGSPPFYLYPMGKRSFGVMKAPHFDSDRIVLNKMCQAVGVLKELPRPTEQIKKAGSHLTKRPEHYDQSNFIYVDCRLS